MGRSVLASLKKESGIETHLAIVSILIIVRLEFKITLFLNACIFNENEKPCFEST
jgi:hypothetical protein